MENSYGEFYRRKSIILRDLDTSAALQCLANPLFVKEAKAQELELFNKYVRDANLTNGYRRGYEIDRIASDEAER